MLKLFGRAYFGDSVIFSIGMCVPYTELGGCPIIGNSIYGS